MFSLHNYGGLYYRLEPHFLSVYFIPISQYSERRNFAASPIGFSDVERAIQTQKRIRLLWHILFCFILADSKPIYEAIFFT